MASPLIALYCVYNEAKNIEKSIRSVISVVDEVRVYDGAFSKYPHTQPWSTDATKDIVNRLHSEFGKVYWIGTETTYPTQIAKRTRMLQELPRDSVGFIIDGDEILVNPQDFSKEELDGMDVGWLDVHSNLYKAPYLTPRFFRSSIPGIHYAGKHHWIYDGEGYLVTSHRNYTHRYAHGNVQARLFNLRCDVRENDKKKFRNARNPLESAHSNELQVYGMDTPESLKLCQEACAEFKFAMHVLKKPIRPKYTLMVLFSRSWAIERWMRHFKKVEMDWPNTEIVAVVDHQDPDVFKLVTKSFNALYSNANGIRVYHTKKPPLPELMNVSNRRDRIVENWNIILSEFKGSILLGAEDDTLPDVDAYTKMLRTMEEKEAAFVQATILGRWSLPVIPHWQIEYTETNKSPYSISSAAEGSEDIIPIQGGGWYCFVTTVAAARRFKLKWTAPGKESDGPPMGPDLWFVFNLASHGEKCYGDWTINCLHFLKNRDLHPYYINNAAMMKNTLQKNGTWSFTRSEIPSPRKGLSWYDDEIIMEEENMFYKKYIALKSWQGVEGDVFRGAMVTITSATRAQQLLSRGLIAEINSTQSNQTQEADTEPVSKPVPKVAPPQPIAQPVDLASLFQEIEDVEEALSQPVVAYEDSAETEEVAEAEEDDVKGHSWYRVRSGLYMDENSDASIAKDGRNWTLTGADFPEELSFDNLHTAKLYADGLTS